MIDMEKVIKGMEELSGFLFKEYGKVQAEEADLYYDRFLTVDNAIFLLKKQEAVYPIKDIAGNKRCPKCFTILKGKFCHECGQAVKWDE